MKKIIISFLFLFPVPFVSFAASYLASCPAEAQSIIEAVGGCGKIDVAAYGAISEKCCTVPAAQQSAVFWAVAAVVVVGLIAVAVWRVKFKK